VTRPRTTKGKRNVQQHKLEKRQAKQERKAARRLESSELDTATVDASEAELIDRLAALHAAVEAAAISQEEFESRRELIRLQLDQLARRVS
jgi:hypothetical protein